MSRVRQLPEEDRLLFDKLLARQENLEWRKEAAKARRVAERRGIDQDAIDRALHTLRHGE